MMNENDPNWKLGPAFLRGVKRAWRIARGFFDPGMPLPRELHEPGMPILFRIITLCFIGLFLLLVGMIIYGLTGGHRDVLRASLGLMIMLLLFLGFVTLAGGVSQAAWERGKRTPVLQCFLALMGAVGLALPLLGRLMPEQIPADELLRTAAFLIPLSLLAPVPLIVFLFRLTHPCARQKAKWWQLALLVFGAAGLAADLSMSLVQLSGAKERGGMLIPGFLLMAALHVAAMLPFFLRR